MLSIVFLLYLAAVLMLAYVVYTRGGGAAAVALLASFFLAFDTQGWFLVWFSDAVTAWPVHSLQDVVVVALRGVSNPTTIPELAVVSVGRLILLLALLYGAFFVLRARDAFWVRVCAMPTAQLCCVTLWVVGLIAHMVLRALGGEMLSPMAGIAGILAAIGAAGLAFNLLMDFIRQRRAAKPETTV